MIRVLAFLLALAPALAWGQGNLTPGTASPSAFPGFVTGNWYWPLRIGPANTPAASGGNLIPCVPGEVGQTATINTLGASSTTTDNGKHLQIAIYNAGSWGRPSTLVVATSDITMGAVAGVLNGAASAQLAAGAYWFCSNTDSATAVFRSISGANNTAGGAMVGSANQSNITGATPVTSVSIAGTYGTWPTFTSSTSWTDITTVIMPLLAFKIASVP